MRTAASVYALVIGAALLAPSIAAAQGSTVEELVVTAGKREQSLQDVPVSVAVVTGEKIKDLSITNLDELSAYVPGLTITEGGEQTGISIRGFGASLNFGIDQSVGLFVDEIYAGRERQFRGTFLDVGRVEVLKGPQGTLFGKNTIAGAVTIQNGTPTQDPSLSVRGEYSPTTNLRSIEAVANGPLTDTLSARLAVRFADNDGYMYNTLTKMDEEQETDKIGRLTLLWKPTDRLSVRGKVEYSEYDRKGRAFNISEISGFAVNRPVRGANAVPLAAPVDVGAAALLSTYLFYDPLFNYGLDYTTSKQLETAHVVSKNAALDISYDLGPGTIRSITGYNSYESNDQRDVDWSPTPYLYEPITQDFTQKSQEIRYVSDIGEKFDFITGLFWFKTDFYVDRRTDVDINLFFPDRALNLASRKYSSLRFLEQTAETKSVYFQGTYHFTPNLHLTAGARWMTETKTGTDRLDNAQYQTTRFLDPVNNPADKAILDQLVALNLNQALNATRHSFKGKMTEENTIPEAKLSWDINDDAMVYLSVGKGFKGGGFNSNSNNQTSSTGNDFTFRPETVIAWEFGGKLRWPDLGLNTNFAFFRSDFEDLQLSLWTGNGFFLTNAGAARSQGFEGDFAWQATDKLRINGAVSLIDAKYTERVELGCNLSQLIFLDQTGCIILPNAAATRVQNGEGRRFAPKYTASLGAGYVQPITDDMEVLFRADGNFRAKGESAIDPSIVQPALQTLDLSATLRSTNPDRRWSLGVFVQNATDEKYFYYEFEAPAQSGTRIGFPAPPRRVTIRASWDF